MRQLCCRGRARTNTYSINRLAVAKCWRLQWTQDWGYRMIDSTWRAS
jgi:hypothetical protein